MSTRLKYTLYSVMFPLLMLLTIFFWNVWQNNISIAPVTYADVQPHFNKSVTWLKQNYTRIENTKNPILWWMIKQASVASDDPTLKNIYTRYKKDHIDTHAPNLSTPMFNKLYRPRVPDISMLLQLRDYQIFFFYALSCDAELASEPLIQKQLQVNFCSSHFLHPRCITHQLMGLRFMQRYQCGFDEIVSSTITGLQDIVVTELVWDFRVVDAYIQRVLMLIDTGAYERVEPVWIQNILQAQNTDGSWDDLHPLFHIGDDKAFGFTSLLPAIKSEQANFHATAQAIWLLALLMEKTEPREKN